MKKYNCLCNKAWRGKKIFFFFKKKTKIRTKNKSCILYKRLEKYRKNFRLLWINCQKYYNQNLHTAHIACIHLQSFCSTQTVSTIRRIEIVVPEYRVKNTFVLGKKKNQRNREEKQTVEDREELESESFDLYSPLRRMILFRLVCEVLYNFPGLLYVIYARYIRLLHFVFSAVKLQDRFPLTLGILYLKYIDFQKTRVNELCRCFIEYFEK